MLIFKQPEQKILEVRCAPLLRDIYHMLKLFHRAEQREFNLITLKTFLTIR